MAMATAKSQCCICKKETSTFTCAGCSQNFCRNDLTKHFQSLSKQFDEIENYHDEIRQTIIEQKQDLTKHSLIQQVNQWEQDSIYKIKQTADECRQKLMKYTNKYTITLENKLNNLAKKLKETREENEFNEIDLNQLKEKLTKLEEELHKPTNVSIKQESTSFINKISVIMPFDTKWKQVGVTIAGGNDSGNQLNQLSQPFSILIYDDQTIYVTEYGNHRIVEWKSNAKNGRIVAGGNDSGNQMNQLSRPTDLIIDKENDSLIISDFGNRRVMQWFRQNDANGQIIISNIDCWGLAMDKNGFLYVSDCKKNEVRRWKRGEKNGTIVAGGNGKGDQLNQFSFPTFIVVDEDHSLYVSDTSNHRVMKWLNDAKQGIVVAGGNGEGKSLRQLSYPTGVIVDQLGQIYVTDRSNNRVMFWCKGAREGTIVVGGSEEDEQSNQLNNPRGLSFDSQGNLYVVDCGNQQIQKFEID